MASTILQNIMKGSAPSNTPSILPTAATKTTSYADLLPARPTYTPYARQEFDDSPITNGPGAEHGWTWTPGIKSRQIWDAEQDQKANDVLQQYNLDLAGWQDALKIAQAEDERKRKELELQNAQLAAQGLVPTTSLSDPTPIIRQAGAEWQKAKAAGNQQAMNYWHGVAEQARIGAGWGSGGADGSLTARYMTNAGLPTWERQYKDTAYQDALKQQDLENSMKVAALAAKGRGGGSGSGGGGGSGSGGAYPYRLYDDLVAIWKVTGKAPAGLEALGITPGTPYTGQEATGPTGRPLSDETLAFQRHLMKFNKGGNARRYLQQFSGQGVDAAYLGEWGKNYFGDEWFNDPTVTFDKYGKATAIPKKK